MSAESQRWKFWDCGVVQYVQDTLTGECLPCYGCRGASFTGGPFAFAAEEDRPILIDNDGSEDTCSLHDAGEASSYIVNKGAQRVIGEEDDLLQDKASGYLISGANDPRRCWSWWSKAVSSPFKCQFDWHRAPVTCGDEPVRLFMDFRWLLRYILQSKHSMKTYRFAEQLKGSWCSTGSMRATSKFPA